MKKSNTEIRTTSDVTLEMLFAKSYLTEPGQCDKFTGYEIALRLRDESGMKVKTLLTTITAETAKEMAERLNAMADKILQTRF